MKKKGIVIGIVVLAVILLTTGIILIFTNSNTSTTKVPTEKITVEETTIKKLEKKLTIEGYTLKYVKHEGKVYYFNQLDKDGKVALEVQYDEEKDSISTIDKNTISEGQVEPGTAIGTGNE